MKTLIKGRGKEGDVMNSDWALKCIKIMEKHILAFNSAPDESRSSNSPIYSIFECLYFNDHQVPVKQKGEAGEAEPIYFPGDKHCEAILAAFLLHFDPAVTNQLRRKT
jgi:hypothetical protein